MLRVGAFLILASLAACASPTQRLFPREIPWYQDYVAPAGEPALWNDARAGLHGGQIRLVMDSIFRSGNRAIIRIDRTRIGRPVGRLVLGQDIGEGRWRIIEARTFSVSQAQLAQLDAVIAQAHLWQTYPEFWENSDPAVICLDGIGAVLERVTDQGYGFSSANLQCDAPARFLAVARELVAITQAPELRHWVY